MSFSHFAVPDWIAQNAQRKPLNYNGLLPVQQAVVPFIFRAITAGIPLDVCLSAPTGSGKTLCYAIPMVKAVAEAKLLHGDTQVRGIVLVPTKALGTQVSHVLKHLTKDTDIKLACICGDNVSEETKLLQRSVETADGTTRYYANCDIIIATPQRMMKHVGALSGVSLESNVEAGGAFGNVKKGAIALRYLRMIVIDEADEVLAGSFTNIAAQVIQHYEEEVASMAALAEATTGCSDAVSGYSLHKMLCSATLSTHIVKIADVKLRNTKFFSLDSEGNSQSAQSKESERTDWRVTTKFALPQRLHEHLLIVQDQYRHASIMNLVRHIIKKEGGAKGRSGQTILVFCSQSSAARMLGHFFITAGINVMEFTSLTDTVERKKAILSAIAGNVQVVVTTDALMRGIDMPGVGHVIMYDAPRNLQQYVHRIGRTARAGLEGHAYILASRMGPSGTLADGEVAHFRGFDAMLKRVNEVVQMERSIQMVPMEVIEEANEHMQRASAATGVAFGAGMALPPKEAAPVVEEVAEETHVAADNKKAASSAPSEAVEEGQKEVTSKIIAAPALPKLSVPPPTATTMSSKFKKRVQEQSSSSSDDEEEALDTKRKRKEVDLNMV